MNILSNKIIIINRYKIKENIHIIQVVILNLKIVNNINNIKIIEILMDSILKLEPPLKLMIVDIINLILIIIKIMIKLIRLDKIRVI